MLNTKRNLQKQALSGVLADATCDFTDAGTLAMTESVLEVKNLQVNLDLCKSTFWILGKFTDESWCWCASSCFF
jgi:hypothetical protein